MKINWTFILFFLFYLVFNSDGQSQENELLEADVNYEGLKYFDSQKKYQSLIEKGYTSEAIYKKLGNTYYFNAQYHKALQWYDALFELHSNPEHIIFLRYSQALKATGNNEKAKIVYDAYVAKSKTAINAKTAIDYLELIEQNSMRFELKPIEALYDEKNISFGHTKVGNKLIYASTKTENTFLNTKSAWDGLGFFSLFEIELNDENSAVRKPRKIRGRLKRKYHVTTPVYTKDGNTVYFTTTNLSNKDDKNNQNLKIYRAVKKGNNWQKPKALQLNSDYYSSAHPALSPDETKLYFSSNRPGGFGASDLYVTSIAADGSLSEPVNLGPEINTAGKETFPFVSDSNELYFSSDGHFGLGGLDVFYIKIKDQGYGSLLNVGAPINTYADDFAFGMDDTTKRGFVSSNRSKNEGSFVYDNIYSFKETAPIVDVYRAEINGLVTNKETSQPIEGAAITLSDAEGNIHTTLTTNKKGIYAADTNKFKVYFVRAVHNDYNMDEKISKPRLDSQSINFQLQSNDEKIISGGDLAKVLHIPIIYFDFDKSNIRNDAKKELEKIIAALNDYPQLKLNIRSHTDSRGNDVYNKALSKRRAASVLNYLVSKGVDSSRLKSEGLGESELVNHCGNGVSCSEVNHQKNRRSEFIILD